MIERTEHPQEIIELHDSAIRRVARAMVGAFGEKAHDHALRCSARSGQEPDREGELIWTLISAEIKRLQ